MALDYTHGQPLDLLVRQSCDITIGKESCESEVNAKSIIRLLSMRLSKGTNIIIRANGEDKLEELETLTALVDSGCGE